MTEIIPRAAWGARHRDGFGTRTVGRLEKWLHHSVTTNLSPSATLAQEHAQMRALEDIGQQRFAGGISYTFAAFPSGRIYQGHSVDRIGAHTQGHNTVGVGIVLVGTYTTTAPTPAQEQAIAWLLRHGVDQGWWVQALLSGGHRDTKATACPGDAAYPRIPAINALAQIAPTPDPDPEPEPTPIPESPPAYVLEEDDVHEIIRSLYRRHLLREPKDPGDLDHWTDVYARTGDITAVRDGIYSSPEARAKRAAASAALAVTTEGGTR